MTSRKRRRRAPAKRSPETSVFINCPFDDGEIGRAISALRDWLRTSTGHSEMPGGKDIKARFDVFNAELPAICARMRLTDDELTFADFYAIAATWLDEHLTTPPPSPVGR